MSGRSFSAAILGEDAAGEITNSVPVQDKPTGVGGGVPSSALSASWATGVVVGCSLCAGRGLLLTGHEIGAGAPGLRCWRWWPPPVVI
jgi:hypothetical protein